MKKVVVILLVGLGLAAYVVQQRHIIEPITKDLSTNIITPSDPIAQAFRDRESDVQIQAVGTVVRILSDDLVGSRHQRFIVKLPSGQTLLVAHNIDIAPRIDILKKGDSVEFYGEYEWNSKGGVVHWTHRDPGGKHVHGWLRHRGRTYQ